jgi:hypothetical protein
MNIRSNSILTSSCILRFGSIDAISGEPARSSSQFGPQTGSMRLPVTSDLGRATGLSPSFASISDP